MRAFINDGQGLGSYHIQVTRKYKSIPNLFKYAIKPFMRTHGDYCKAEVFYNWDNRYGTPDKVIVYTRESGMILREDIRSVS